MPQSADVRRNLCRQRDAAGVCTNCGRQRDSGNQLCMRCGATSRRASEKWKAAQTDYDKKKALRRKYGLTMEQWDSLFAAQGHACELCRTTAPVGGWTVDHDHASGRVRAILCRLCNIGLGSFRDDPELLERAAAYLRKHKLALVG